MGIALQIILNGLVVASLYALVAVGLSFLYATSRIFHLAHGVVVVGAGYAFWWGLARAGLHWALAALLAMFAAALLGLLMNDLVYERLRSRGAKGLGYLIATLALLMLGAGLIQLVFGAQPRTFQIEQRIFAFGEVRLTSIDALAIGIGAALVLAFFAITRFTKFGKAMRATADNETVAEIVGIPTRSVRRRAFLLASLLAAAAGILIGLEFNLDPQMGIAYAVFGFTAAVVGGVGSVGGAILGSLLIGLFEQGVVWFIGAGWRNAATFILLFIFLLVRPQGIFGMPRT